MKHKKAVPRDFLIPVMMLALDILSSDLIFLNSKRDYLHTKENMGINIYEAHQTCKPCTLGIEHCSDGWFTLTYRWAKSQGNIEPQTKLPDHRATLQKLHIANSQKKNTTYL